MYFLVIQPDNTGNRTRQVYRRAAAALAGCSYSVYIVHLPLLLLFRTSIVSPVWTATTGHIGLGVAIAAVVFLAGYGFSRLTEAHTDPVRTQIFGLIGVPGGLTTVRKS